MNDLSQLWARLALVRRWVLVAAVLALGLTIYYGVMGVKYWNATRAEGAVREEIRTVSASLQRSLPDENLALAQVAQQRSLLERQMAPFPERESTQVLDLITSIASGAGVDVSSVGEPACGAEVFNGVRFLTQPFSLVVFGSPTRVFNFLDGLHRAIPGLDVRSVGFAEDEDATVAHLEIVVFMLPEVDDVSQLLAADNPATSGRNRATGANGNTQ